MNRKAVQRLIDTAPPKWRKMFKRYKLGSKPSVDSLIDVALDYTPSGNLYGEEGESLYTPPQSVRKEAMEGLRRSHATNYTSGSGIGLVRAMQLVVDKKIPYRSVKRMRSYFARSKKDTPVRYMAWLNWGGDSGKRWVDNLPKKKKNPPVGKFKDKDISYQMVEGHNELEFLFKVKEDEVEGLYAARDQVPQPELIGRIDVKWSGDYWDEDKIENECDTTVEVLKERFSSTYPDIKDGYEVFVLGAYIYPATLEGVGLGTTMYEIAIGELWKHLKYPFFLIPDECKQGSTSKAATRVWRRLSQMYPSEELPQYTLHEYNYGLAVLAIVKEPKPVKVKTFQKRQRNPRSIKTKLVSPSQVRLVGFCPKKTKILKKHIPVALKAVQHVFNTRSKFPSPIYPMEPEEVAKGRSSIDKGHPKGAGHGLYFPDYQLVKINSNMEPIDILANVVHENIHHIDPGLRELEVRKLTIRIMDEVFNVPTDGRPYAK